MAGRQQPDSGATGDEQTSQGAAADHVEPVGDRARARAERRAERRRRGEERRRRWSSPRGGAAGEAGQTGPTGPTADGGGTAVLTRDDDPDGPDTPAGQGPTGLAVPAAPSDEAAGNTGATASSAAPARGPSLLWQLVLAAHPRQAALTAAGMAGAATLAGRSLAEVGTLAAMVLIGQSMLGWHNDLVDRDRDAVAVAAERARPADAGPDGEGRRTRPKPVAEGRLEPGTVWYALALALLLLAPLSVANGVNAALAYAVVLVIGMLGNVVLRGGWLSWLPWAASFALYPAVLAYAGPPGTTDVTPPQPALVVLAALLGVVVHVLRALPGLVQDHRDGLRHLPLRIALRTGAPRLLVISSVLAVALVVALVVTGTQVGLTL